MVPADASVHDDDNYNQKGVVRIKHTIHMVKRICLSSEPEASKGSRVLTFVTQLQCLWHTDPKLVRWQGKAGLLANPKLAIFAASCVIVRVLQKLTKSGQRSLHEVVCDILPDSIVKIQKAPWSLLENLQWFEFAPPPRS